MNWLVIGGGVSGLGAAKLLRKQGHTVRVSDGRPLKPELKKSFQDLGVDVRDGGHALAHLDDVQHIVISPGLPQNHELLVAAKVRGLPMISEIDLALQFYKGRVIAVTGTNGKSTTCAMLGHVLDRAGHRVSVGGNFGDPPTAMLAEGRIGDFLVLELSSYQLEQSELIAPEAAVFTSFSFDHLARHGSLANYLKAKWRVFERFPKNACAVMPDYVAALAKAEGLTVPPGTVLSFNERRAMKDFSGPGFVVEDDGLLLSSGERLPLAELALRERQNLLNAGFTLTVAAALLKRSPSELAPYLAGFRGLAHRCELVGTWRGHRIVNDSKSTNVESTLVALQSQTAPVLLLMGGQGKGEPYEPILAEKAKIAAVITFGASRAEITKGLSPALPVQEFPTLKAALAAIGGILEEAPRGVLFSPGCASFDEFTNYEARGRFFCDAMTAIGMRST